jgi:2-desacetyl-2-hydroxyethyl bacteriochlorophyllide A dehydrogenase
MPQELILIRPRQLEFRTYDDPPLEPHQIRAEALLSGISHGTEMNLYTGSNPFVDQEFDTALRLFVPRQKKEPEVMYPGYEWVGQVTEVGAAVTRFRVGDLIHLPYHHRQTHTFSEEDTTMLGRIFPLPPGMSPDKAVVLALAGVALQTIHDARLKVGDRVAIFGMGAIGLLAVQLAKLNGASFICAVDPLRARRELAEHYGADQVLNPDEQDVAYELKSTQGGVDVAIELSGSYAALNDAIRAVRMAGTVVAGGYYRGGGTALQLGAEWHHNRITLLSSMGVWDCPHRDFPSWTRGRVHDTAVYLLASGKLHIDGLITRYIRFDKAPEAYQLIEDHPEDVLKVVLAY